MYKTIILSVHMHNVTSLLAIHARTHTHTHTYKGNLKIGLYILTLKLMLQV